LKGFIMELKDIVETGLKAQEAKLEAAIEKFEGQLQEKGKVDSEVKAEVKALADEFKSLASSVTELAQKQTVAASQSAKPLSAAEEFVKSSQYKALVEGNIQRARIELKNTVTSTSDTVFPMQKPGIIPGNFAPLSVRAVLPSMAVSSNMVNALRESTWVSSAAEVSQGASKPESDFGMEPYNVPIETVAHWIKISNQLLADAPAVVSYIETRLRDGLAQRIDAQLLNGNGSTPNLSGLTDSGNFVAYIPESDDTLVDAINRAKYTLWTTGNMPDTVIVNPADWGAMERTRESAGGGFYLYGMPGTAAAMNPFGVQVVISKDMTPGKFLIGALNSSTMVYNRSGAVVEMGYINEDFTKNLITIRAEERLGLAVERPQAIFYGDFSA
jgi:HK97 family phage major capsid protein